ncbi:MAG: LysM peptidoglycan-binding domain-containing protein [Nitrososphaerales archaeon]
MRKRIALTLVLSLLATLLLAAPTAADQGGTHVVRSGETLASIAKQFGVSTAALANANGISNPDRIWVGQTLVIPSGGAKTGGSSSGGGSAASSGGTYVVRRGDTLGAIAQRLGVSASALAAANGITNPDRIYVGMVLRIPGKSSGAVTGPASPSKVKDTRFVVDISAQHCWLYQGGVLTGNWRCSTGRRGAPTAPGTYRIQSKIPKAWGSTWGFWMPYWLGIYWAGSTENGIHGLPYYQNGRRTWAGLVGTPITYGCVMLDDANARKLYSVAYIGMPVVIQR